MILYGSHIQVILTKCVCKFSLINSNNMHSITHYLLATILNSGDVRKTTDMISALTGLQFSFVSRQQRFVNHLPHRQV
jgi:Zn-dependent M32 family carboxypeptidase